MSFLKVRNYLDVIIELSLVMTGPSVLACISSAGRTQKKKLHHILEDSEDD
jgi:hypothetical protein